tara:strand:- start:93 stop:776 length:684 start_codon:yes stop_codon:yes gene_type:complete
MNMPDIENLLSKEIINSKLYKDSLTHRSASNINNERLEFFGDSILGFIITEYLYKKYPNDDEGSLSRKRSYLVRKESLYKIAKFYNLGDKIILGQGEKKSGGHRRESIIADALEALIGVVYLIDGIYSAEKFVHGIFEKSFDSLPTNEDLKDPKTKLQEILQSYNYDLPEYYTTEINQKNKIGFKTLCKIKEHKICEEGFGSNKRKSQQEAARKTLNIISNIFNKNE